MHHNILKVSEVLVTRKDHVTGLLSLMHVSNRIYWTEVYVCMSVCLSKATQSSASPHLPSMHLCGVLSPWWRFSRRSDKYHTHINTERWQRSRTTLRVVFRSLWGQLCFHLVRWCCWGGSARLTWADKRLLLGLYLWTWLDLINCSAESSQHIEEGESLPVLNDIKLLVREITWI